MTTIRAFFSNQGTFSQFSKKGRGDLPLLPPSSYAPDPNIKNYKRQRNCVVNLNKNAKFEYFDRYNAKDSKPFWVSSKLYFSTKHSKANTSVTLTENGDLVLKSNEITDTFNKQFGTIVEDPDL